MKLTGKYKRLFDHYTENYDLEPHRKLILEKVCESAEKCDEWARILKREGDFLNNRFGERKTHPALDALQKEKIILVRLWRELGVSEIEEDAPRPPRLAYGGR